MDRSQGRPETYFWFTICFFLFFITAIPLLKASSKGAKQQELTNNLEKLTRALSELIQEKEEPKTLGVKKLKYKNTLLTQGKEVSKTEWEKTPLKERAEFLINQFDRKAEGLVIQMSAEELQEKYIETVSLMAVDGAGILAKAGRTAVGIEIPIEGFAWALILAINAIKTIASKEYLARLDELDKLTSCINFSDEKRSELKVCASVHCVSMNSCIIRLLDDLQYLLMPVVSLSIVGTQIGGKRVQGIFPLIFQVFAPKAQATKHITEFSDTLYLFMELLGQIKVLLLTEEKQKNIKGSGSIKK